MMRNESELIIEIIRSSVSDNSTGVTSDILSDRSFKHDVDLMDVINPDYISSSPGLFLIVVNGEPLFGFSNSHNLRPGSTVESVTSRNPLIRTTSDRTLFWLKLYSQDVKKHLNLIEPRLRSFTERDIDDLYLKYNLNRIESCDE